MGQTTIETELIVHNEHGLHARPATEFVRKATEFEADIRIQNLDRHSELRNAKSIVDVLASGIDRNHRIRLVASGVDAQRAIAALTALVGGTSRRERARDVAF